MRVTVAVELVGGSDVGPSPSLLPPERPGQTKLTCLVVKSGNGFGRFMSADVLEGFLGTLIDSSAMNCLQPQVMKPSTTFSGPPQAAWAIMEGRMLEKRKFWKISKSLRNRTYVAFFLHHPAVQRLPYASQGVSGGLRLRHRGPGSTKASIRKIVQLTVPIGVYIEF